MRVVEWTLGQFICPTASWLQWKPGPFSLSRFTAGCDGNPFRPSRKPHIQSQTQHLPNRHTSARSLQARPLPHIHTWTSGASTAAHCQAERSCLSPVSSPSAQATARRPMAAKTCRCPTE